MENMRKYKDKKDRPIASVPEQIPLPFMSLPEKKASKTRKAAGKNS